MNEDKSKVMKCPREVGGRRLDFGLNGELLKEALNI